MLYRSVDGSGNNLFNMEMNAAGTDYVRIGPANFADGVSTPIEGVNPRIISNIVVGEGDAVGPNSLGLSGMMYAWGQFIDHDITLEGSGTTPFNIVVPDGDPVFADGTVIFMNRVKPDPESGTGTDNPAIAMNTNTGWLDGSMVYGSDAATAAALRLADGHLASSAGGNLPIVNGNYLAGDVRAMENPSLTALQTIFLREHNWQVDRLAAADPTLTGDELYLQAKAIVTAEIAHITYSEFLPHLLGSDALPGYAGYDPTVDARLSIEFTGAAYRFGHSIVSAETERVDEQGNVTGPELLLRDTFFLDPAGFALGGGADGFIRHLGDDASQEMDARIVEDLRNFLFDPPVGLDLAAINIQRGRDLGLGTLNQTRVALGLEAYTDFAQITDDQGTVTALRAAFASVDDIDLWTGGLAEGHAPGAFVGETFARIIGDQFIALRDGDRFWYQNQGFDADTLAMIEHTTLSDIVLRTTDTQYIQPDLFLFYDRLAPGVVPDEEGDVRRLVVGTAADEKLTGGGQDDILHGGGGHDTLEGGAGNDSIDGGAGIDTLVVGWARDAVTVTITGLIGSAISGTISHGGELDSFSGIETLQFADGRLVFDATDAICQVTRMYYTALDRAPDALGLNQWAAYLQSGHSMQELGEAFAGSAEFQARYGSLDDGAFITVLYENAMGREPDEGGYAAWTGFLAAGHSRGEALALFSDSAEGYAHTAALWTNGIWDTDETGASVARMYYAALGRAPDEAGWQVWTAQVKDGLWLGDLAALFVSSAELRDGHPGLNDASYVDLLYENTLGRDPTQPELDGWLDALGSHQTNWAMMLLNFSESQEFAERMLPVIEGGIAFA